MAIAGLHSVSVFEPDTAGRPNGEERSRNRPSSILQMWRELEDEHLLGQSSPGRERQLHQRIETLNRINNSDAQEDASTAGTEEREWSHSPDGSENGHEDSSDLGESERERVRQIFRDWRSSCSRERSSSIRGSRGEWLGETEQERVRMIREWAQLTSQQRDSHNSVRIDQVLDGQIENSNRRSIRRLCGRQALLDMLKKAERERQLEIERLSEHRAVSQFAHRIRIQSVLRGRFLRNDRGNEDRVDLPRRRGELGMLRQRNTVSDIREGFISLSENSPGAHASSAGNSSNMEINNEEQEIAPSSRNENNVAESETHHVNTDSDQHSDQTQHSSNEYNAEFTENREESQAMNAQGSSISESVLESSVPSEQGDDSSYEQNINHNSVVEDEGFSEAENRDEMSENLEQEYHSLRRIDSFYLPEGDGAQTSELRELLNRRSVSTLLRSGFRRDLDELLQSYIQRQNAPVEEEQPEASVAAEEHHPPPADEILDDPFVLPRQRWDGDANEWDIINDLRIDMARLQHRMNSMQKMLEACMDMQLELQRSIKQEISSALNRSLPPEDGAKWDDVRRGFCCVCRSSSIDTLLYRCGHLCTCAKCADDLLRAAGKCPMCFAPVAEVVRAYSL